MIPEKIDPTCDACKQAIDTSKGFISLQPLRGGLTLVANNGTGEASQLINKRADFCDGTCVQDYLKKLAEKIVAPPAAAPGASAKTAAA